MSEEKQIEEMDCKKCLHYEMCLENFREAKKEGFWEFTDEEKYFSHAGECDFYAAGYRKQSEGEWITRHRHRGGFRTVTVTDSFGEKHTGMVDERWECDDLYCSVCGKISHDAFLNYCANCGAKMKGGE